MLESLRKMLVISIPNDASTKSPTQACSQNPSSLITETLGSRRSDNLTHLLLFKLILDLRGRGGSLEYFHSGGSGVVIYFGIGERVLRCLQ